MQKSRLTKHGFFPTLTVRTRPGHVTQGLLEVEGRVLRCALGRSGIGRKRGEGDGITPLGRFSLVSALLRTDRIPVRDTELMCEIISKNDGWCDATGDRNYNRYVPLPYEASHENLWRDDHLYDVVVIMDYNINQRLSTGGSAIFFHLAHADYRPTEGCVAISRKDMLWLLPHIGPQTTMVIR